MKAGIFALTRKEQRVVILLVIALVAAAFFRYWRVVSTSPKPNQSAHIEPAATPFSSPEEDAESD
jgi:hypothetical protein